MIKNVFFILVIIVFPIFGQQSDGPFFVSPEPPFCSERDTEKLCAATACAMVMEYWNRQEIVNDKYCKGFATEFCSQYGFTSDGGANPAPTIFENALKNVAKNNLNDMTMKVYAKHISSSLYDEIKRNLKYKDQNDRKSPWDRAGIINFLYDEINKNENFRIAHAVLVWGCGKNSRGQIYYIYKDPIWNENSNFRNRFNLKGNSNCYFVYLYPEKCE